MDGINALIDGFGTALTPKNLLYAVIGVVLGTAIGVLPGIGPAMTIALLLPLTFTLEPTQAFIMFAGIYYGGMYGGSTTSILLNTPGESASVITAIEGNLMAKKGRGAAALATAAIGSFIAGTIGTLALALVAPQIVKLAIKLGAPDYFAIMMLAFIAVTTVLGSSKIRGLAVARHRPAHRHRSASTRPPASSGSPSASPSSPTASTSSWSRSACSRSARRCGSPPTCAATRPRSSTVDGARMNREDWRRSWKPWLRGTAIGFPFGAIPAGGAEIPTFLSYAMEKKLTKHPEEFGHGAIEGVAGPEATNNASAAGGLVPLLTLGIPTTATAAVMLGAFQCYGIQPGPRLLDDQSELVWGLIASPVHRQRDPARAEPAAGDRSGPAAATSRAPTSTPASCSSPASAPTPRTPRPSTCGCCSSSAGSASSCAASACRWCRRSSRSSSARWPRSSCGGRCRSATASCPASTTRRSPRSSTRSSSSCSSSPWSSTACGRGADGDHGDGTHGRPAARPPARQPGRAVTMAIVVGFVPRPEGHAALDRAIEEAKLRGAAAGRPQREPRRRPGRLEVRVVLRLGGRQGAARGVRGGARGRPDRRGPRPRRPAAARGRGDQRRAHRHRPAPSHPGRQAHHGQRGPDRAARRGRPRARRQGGAGT